jgi:geranylgeranyl diphosphate synthase type I
MSDFQAELAGRAKKVDARLLKYIDQGKYKKMREAMLHYPAAGGKRMRPVLAMLVADAVGGRGDAAIPFGCCLEIIHNFTLVHDDVIDQDPVRRGQPAVHIKWDIPTAIIAGDALFARAYEVLADTDVPDKDLRRLLRITSEAIFLVAEGQQMDVDFEKLPTVSLADYEEMVEKKTAVLFGCAAEGGAIIGGGSEKQVKDMKEYARLFGIAFQMWDDVLGVVGDPKKVGKPVGNDVRNGKRTLIVVHALEHLPEGKQRDTLLKALGNQKATEAEIKAAIQVLKGAGSIDHISGLAKKMAQEANAKLACLKDGDEKRALAALAEYSVARES